MDFSFPWRSFFGIPLLLLRFWEQGRDKPLHFVGPEGLEEVVRASMKLAFPTLADKISFDYVFHELKEGKEEEILGISFAAAYTGHGQPNLGVRIGDGKNSLYYSGDGPPKKLCYQLAAGCDLIVQESFLLDKNIYGHGNCMDSIAFARKLNVKKIALIHIQRDARDEIVKYFEKNKSDFEDLEVYIPVPGDKIIL